MKLETVRGEDDGREEADKVARVMRLEACSAVPVWGMNQRKMKQRARRSQMTRRS
jgi:hypothetical protein